MSKIQVSAKIKIPQAMLEEFKQQAAECIKQVKENDVGTLQYDLFLSTDKTECDFLFAYYQKTWNNHSFINDDKTCVFRS